MGELYRRIDEVGQWWENTPDARYANSQMRFAAEEGKLNSEVFSEMCAIIAKEAQAEVVNEDQIDRLQNLFDQNKLSLRASNEVEEKRRILKNIN